MRSDRANENPFDSIKASDFSDAEILDHWVDISEEHGGLLNIIKPRLIMPMLLLGGKGSGKTHLMRYCSAPVQAARFAGNLYDAVSTERYLGIYVRAEGLNTDKFAEKGQDVQTWLPVFSMYFELWLATALVTNLRDLLHGRELGVTFSENFATKVGELFDCDVALEFTCINSFLSYLTRLRKHVDFTVNNAALTRDISDIVITFSPGRLVFGLPKVIGTLVSELTDVIFVYLIDEAENFSEAQQRFLNSLIRYRSGNASIKIGARLYGIRTYETLGAGEPIKREAEYERVELDAFLRG
jgi:hypothetical protein